MRLFVVIALAVLALAESASLKKKSDLPGKILGELQSLEAAKAKEEAALAKKADKREEEDDFGLPDMDIAFNGDGGAFLGVVLTPEDAVCVVSAAEEYGGWIAEGINIYHMAGFFFKERDDWMMGYLMTTDEAIAGVSCLYGADPPPCSYDGTGCDISSYIDTLKGDEDLAISGYGMGMTDAIPMVAGNIDENGVIDEDGVHDAAAALGEEHSGYLVPYAEAVGGVAEALGVDSPILEKKEVAKKKSTEVAELLQKLRETVRNLKQK
ncbi:uncharacterized protein [Branchiostoma lanceolatum]|uniref:uncharacterized protein n=1 Tax=Branchiostoma lanceolatum TaxID=7740 RepID=UPI003455E8CB